jgi:hypothetical protein
VTAEAPTPRARAVRQAAGAVAQGEIIVRGEAPPAPYSTKETRLRADRRAQRQGRYEELSRLHRSGLSTEVIAPALGISATAARRWPRPMEHRRTTSQDSPIWSMDMSRSLNAAGTRDAVTRAGFGGSCANRASRVAGGPLGSTPAARGPATASRRGPARRGVASLVKSPLRQVVDHRTRQAGCAGGHVPCPLGKNSPRSCPGWRTRDRICRLGQKQDGRRPGNAGQGLADQREGNGAERLCAWHQS